mmetsp:Transcript_8770/g.22467  ORF Transcript_8770/g.22467 Transcript_8770/m.22467 type:complete len:132 (-) Transcript_8770:272-667(-)
MAGPLAAMFNQIRSRRGKNSYRFKHPRPQAHVWPHQVPQVMLQMLVTGTERCKFVSFTPTNGIKVFDIRRDAQYVLSYSLSLSLSKTRGNAIEEAERMGKYSQNVCSKLVCFLSPTRQVHRRHALDCEPRL